MDLSADRSGKPLDYLRQIIQSEQLSLGVSIPAIVDSFDPATQMLEATPVIRRRRRLEDGSTEVEDRQRQIKVPLCTPYVRTLGFSLTMPISAGDHVLFIFSDRGIDLWQETGEISDPPDIKNVRAHNYTDAIYILAPIPLSDPIEDYQIDSAELRNRDRSCAIQIWDDHAEVRAPLTNSTEWTIGGDIEEFAPGNIQETALGDIEEFAAGDITETALGDIDGDAGGSISELSVLSNSTTAGTSVNETAVTGNINETATAGSINNTAALAHNITAGTTITVDAGGKILIESDVEVEVKAPIATITAPVVNIAGATTTITGNLIVTGTVTAAGFSGPASAAANFANGLSTPNAVINGIESKTHKHNETGTQTGIPIAGP
jgi:hypothetical protein